MNKPVLPINAEELVPHRPPMLLVKKLLSREGSGLQAVIRQLARQAGMKLPLSIGGINAGLLLAGCS
ncbi:MAG: hypothetical protein CSB24_04440 [Deltaproteobacteria bacterium]|nr:MAG: hypothetical protein CSB24_04440 [Deltaproteobacteria bacterium]